MIGTVNNALAGLVPAAKAKAYLLFPSHPTIKKKVYFSPKPKKRLQ